MGAGGGGATEVGVLSGVVDAGAPRVGVLSGVVNAGVSAGVIVRTRPATVTVTITSNTIAIATHDINK